MSPTADGSLKTYRLKEQGRLAFAFWLRPLLFLTFVFYLNYLSRIVTGPLLPVIEVEFSLGHGEAGSLFLLIASGYCAGIFGSTFVCSRLSHRNTIFLSAVILGGSMLAISQSTSLPQMRVGLLALGFCAGLYLPSGIAVITEVVSKEHWGKAIAFHELAPNLALVTAPLLAESFLRIVSWPYIFGILGASSLTTGVFFLLFGEGGITKGEPPNLKALQETLLNRSFWAMATGFAVLIGTTLGVYTMLPLFLIYETGFDRELANTLIGLSRLPGVIVVFFSGLITDRIGYR